VWWLWDLGRLTGLVCESSAWEKGEARLAGWLAWRRRIFGWMEGWMEGCNKKIAR